MLKAPTSNLIIVQGAYLNLSGMKAPTSDDKSKKCKIMLKAPTSDLIIVQGAYLNLSGMKAPTSNDELKSYKKC